MASIEKLKNKDGSESFRVSIRLKETEVYKTFYTEEDAKLYSFYKERLIKNMENFEIPLKERITLKEILEVKSKSFLELNGKTCSDIENAFHFIMRHLPEKYYHEITYEDWLKCAKNLLKTDVFRGGKTEIGRRKMSIGTLRRHFACASSAVSYAKSQGIEIENMPLKVLQTFINPLLKREEEKE